MSVRLTSLLVEDFRSIRGSQHIVLDAPAVLIHGPNGTGKTSLLSAIEFGLTGAVASLARFDPGYVQHLPHKKSLTGKCRVVVEAEGLGSGAAEVMGDAKATRGEGLLESGLARFFTERCYLPQAALGRLLEIYEHQDSRRSDSPLTRFVKELLGLESLDALIDGLHASGDVRRLREPAPCFWAARAAAPMVAKAVIDAEQDVAAARRRLAEVERDLRGQLEGLVSPETPLDAAALADDLEGYKDEAERRLADMARRRRDLTAAAKQLADAALLGTAAQLSSAQAAASAARQALDVWQREDGVRLSDLLTAIRARFPELPDGAGDAAAIHRAAVQSVDAEVARLTSVLAATAADASTLAEVEEAIRQGNARLTVIESELERDKGANQELAQALTEISTHIQDETCPVCGRDFSEVSKTPLAAHVSEDVQRLIAAAGRVQALVRDRATTLTSLGQAQRRQAELSARRPTSEQLDAFKVDLALFTEWKTNLAELAHAASQGTSLHRQAATAARELSSLNTQQAGISGLRAELGQHAEALDQPAAPDDIPLETVLTDLIQFVEGEDVKAQALLSRLAMIETTFDDLSTVQQELVDALADLQDATDEQALSTERREEADRRIAMGKDLANRAQALRTKKVRRVFNDELNAVWRELFIRLAPDEEFVPAFALPASSSGPVEAVLETLYRSGGTGGNPRAMLSAGNLNTAALTLFLALNLSVKPLLPWLIIDDPVQSMDDVHIAQFAALLRTLKREGRQVILAVHDRQLFDYLALELSPEFNGDRLITVELGRSADGFTTAPWSLTVFEPDRAIAA